MESVQGKVSEFVGLFVLLTGNVADIKANKLVLQLFNLPIKRLQGFVLNPIEATDLLYYQLRVQEDFNLSGTQVSGFFKGGDYGPVLCLVVSGSTYGLGDSGNEVATLVPNGSSYRRWTGVAP